MIKNFNLIKNSHLVCHKDFSSYKDCLAHLQSHLREKCDESQKMSANKQIKSSNYREMINELGIYCCIYCRRGSHNNADSQIFACNRRSKKFKLDKNFADHLIFHLQLKLEIICKSIRISFIIVQTRRIISKS